MSPAEAEMVKKPDQTKAVYVAMLHQKLTRKKPDFAAWVEDSPRFRNAALHERVDMMKQKTAELKEVYGLLTPAEPITLEIPVRMSGYSAREGGFLVPTFSNLTFFSYEYMGKNYAIIPNKIEEHQWLKSPPYLAPSIMEATDNGHNAKILMTLTPHSADPYLVLLKGKKYYLLMTEVSKMEIWSKDGTGTVWDTSLNKPASAKNKILNLYQ